MEAQLIAGLVKNQTRQDAKRKFIQVLPEACLSDTCSKGRELISGENHKLLKYMHQN